ncbi:Uncharacterised protein [Mycobacterium tuberculosis]|nr:Uncharacterised protein [Mycobacterium tuberculosis]CMT00205.1 Uncharacterised protein [Mycobacterium tuberculosis]
MQRRGAGRGVEAVGAQQQPTDPTRAGITRGRSGSADAGVAAVADQHPVAAGPAGTAGHGALPTGAAGPADTPVTGFAEPAGPADPTGAQPAGVTAGTAGSPVGIAEPAGPPGSGVAEQHTGVAAGPTGPTVTT